ERVGAVPVTVQREVAVDDVHDAEPGRAVRGGFQELLELLLGELAVGGAVVAGDEAGLATADDAVGRLLLLEMPGTCGAGHENPPSWQKDQGGSSGGRVVTTPALSYLMARAGSRISSGIPAPQTVVLLEDVRHKLLQLLDFRV